jgi:hypothetical protein
VFLNPLLGLGSFTMGDPLGGGLIAGGYAVAAGLILWELFFIDYDDDLAGIPGVVGIGVAGVTTVFGIMRPLLYHRPGSKSRVAAALSGARIAVLPDAAGLKAVHLGYNFQF